MIKRTDFIMQMERIDKCFPKSFYPDEKLERIWGKLKYLSSEEVVRVFDFIIDNSRFAPIPDEFNKAIRAVGIDAGASRMASEGTNNCKACCGSGFLLASKKSYQGKHWSAGYWPNGEQKFVWDESIAFRCYCKLGEFKDKNIRQWSDQLKHDGYFIHLSE